MPQDYISLLRFGAMAGNTKLAKNLRTKARQHGYRGRMLVLDLPAGHSCPYALDCLSKADRVTGKLTDGPHTKFRCYAASAEALRPNVRNKRWRNYELLRQARSTSEIYDLIVASLDAEDAFDTGSVIRLHSSGDFFNQAYFDAVCLVAAASPSNHYYAYTKALPYVVAAQVRDILPSNLRIIASEGGRRDDLIPAIGRSAKVVYSEAEAERLGLKIDHDDTLAAFGTESFALLIHGTQPQGSEAARAVSAAQRTRLALEAV